MREHIGLFRGKRIDDGEWVEGFYHRVTNSWTHENVHYITHFQDMPITGETILTAQYEVDPDTIGECTGLKANGKLIFEGDIITCYRYGEKWYESLPVEWNELFCEWHTSECQNLYQVAGFKYEIIGNIHDNKELLKGGEG